MKQFLALATLAVLHTAVHAQTLEGRVVGISDGDTVTVLDAHNQQHRVRLAEIDAPESKQAFGERSKQHLASLCHRARASVVITDRDRYGRTVGRIKCNGVDANAEQVRAGMAWVYESYAKDKGLFRLQDEARSAKRGLWSERSPQAPWDWRKASRSGGATTTAQAAAPASRATASANEVRGNKNSMIYHVPGCQHYNSISARNVVVFKTEAAARAAGYRKAGNC